MSALLTTQPFKKSHHVPRTGQRSYHHLRWLWKASTPTLSPLELDLRPLLWAISTNLLWAMEALASVRSDQHPGHGGPLDPGL